LVVAVFIRFEESLKIVFSSNKNPSFVVSF
jgi:hypothetical protein